MKEFIAIDFETANPKRVSACQIGFVRVSNGEIIKTGNYLIKPVGGHAEFQTKIHGIKEEHTSDKPYFNELFPEIKGIFDLPLVAHSMFDKQVLNALSDYFDLGLTFEYHDTASLAKKYYPDLKNHKLKTLVKHFKLPDFKHHDALEDAVACARIYLKLKGQSEEYQETATQGGSSDFTELLSDILEDNKVSYKEAYTLLYWLEDHPAIAREYKRLYLILQEFLSDNILDEDEAFILKRMLEKIKDSV